MKKPRRDNERSRRLTPKKKRASSFDSPEMLGRTLSLLATNIEAAGDFDRAVRLGVIGGFGTMDLSRVKALVPVSRGGTLSHPDADQDWTKLVQDSVASRGTDMEQLRQACAELETPNTQDGMGRSS
jgi:hypothetical protein